MAQRVAFPCYQGKTVNLKVLTPATTAIVNTTTGLTGITNDPTLYLATDIPTTLTGLHRCSATTAGGTSVKFGGYVNLTGTTGVTHYAQDSAAALTVWSATSRTLTQTSSQITAALTGTAIAMRRGDTNTVSFSGLGDLTGWTKLSFAAKRHVNDIDNKAIVWIEKTTTTTTLRRINGGAPTTDHSASITVDDVAAGDITVTLNAAASALLPKFKGLYDVQKKNGTSVETLTEGSFDPVMDIVRATT